jgi:hypothetical protein
LTILSITSAFDKNLTAKQTKIIPDNHIPKFEIPYSQTPNAQTLNSQTDFVLGRTECVGGTCYDWVNGPCASWCVNDPSHGIHVTWLWSNTAAVTDRNMRYNFYDWSTHTWNWFDAANFMNSGIPVFSHVMTSVGGGSDLDRTTGNFVISGNYGTSGSIKPELGRDLVPGGGLFEYSEGPLGWRWPFIAVSQNQSVHLACSDVATTDSLFYIRCSPWGTWSTPINVCPPQPSPMFPNYNITASKVSNKICIVWEESEPVTAQDRAFYRLSNDNGVNWNPPAQLPFPPSVGFAPSFGVSSLFAMYDAQDNLHIVASVSDTGVTVPAEIWHWCPINNPQWSLIHHFDPETLNAPVGYNAIFACRPSIVQEPTTNYFYVSWEQFDSLNYEPTNSRARADIHIAQSNNNGLTWNAKARITDPDQTSKRFPVVGGVQVTPSTTDKDTLLVFYMVDSIAGSFLDGEHRFCVNPMFLHRVPVPLATGFEEQLIANQNLYYSLQIAPNPFWSHAIINYSIPEPHKVSLEIHDITGRLVKTLVNESKLAGTYTTSWNRTDYHERSVPAGIYFASLTTHDKSITKKIIID